MLSGAPLGEALRLDAELELERITQSLRTSVLDRFRRRGAVVAMSGGIDSSLTAALCARAFGSESVFGLLLPERESSGDSAPLAEAVASAFGIETVTEDITGILEASGAYARRDAAIARVVPEYTDGWTSKVVLPGLDDTGTLRMPMLVVRSPDGEQRRLRPTAAVYREIVAATNFKQRARKMLEYFHADRLGYAVVGTPNRLEHDQGFFVKNGDGSADVKPIAHLFKSQVLELARVVGVPSEVIERTPTTDTYTLEQDQEEFFFSLPLDQLDLCVLAVDQGLPAAVVASELGVPEELVERVFDDIARKRSLADYLHARPVVIDEPAAR